MKLLKRIGLRVSGLYDIENDQVIGLNFNFDANFDEGTVEELKEHHKMTQRGDAYVLGSSKNYAYIYFRRKFHEETHCFDRYGRRGKGRWRQR